jgi:FAD/FMN-containing dehydrogenase
MTTHSHVCGLVADTVLEWELVLSSGEVVVAAADGAHSELFRALPFSHGTLGLLVSLRLEVVPAGAGWVQPWASMSLSADFNLIALNDTYDYICH